MRMALNAQLALPVAPESRNLHTCYLPWVVMKKLPEVRYGFL
jgi:hypothetical protein